MEKQKKKSDNIFSAPLNTEDSSEEGAQKHRSILMNGYASDQHHKRLYLIDKSLFITTLLQICLLFLYIETEKTQRQKQNGITKQINQTFFEYSAFICSFFSILFLILRTIVQNRYDELKGQHKNRSQYAFLILQICFFAINPFPFEYKFVMVYNQGASDQRDIQVPFNHILTILATFRIIYSISLYLINSKYLSPRASRICRLYNCHPGLLFSIKSLFKDYPFTFIISISSISVIAFAFTFRIAERQFFQSTNTENKFGVYSDVIWMTIITMTSVGYGDLVQKTPVGRIIGSLCVTWGVLIISVMVFILTSAFSLNRSERQSLLILKKLQAKQRIRQVAAQYIKEIVWRLWQQKKKGVKKENSVGTMKQRKLLLQFRKQRRIYTLNTINENCHDLFNQISRQFERSFTNVDNLAKNNQMIINYLNEEYIFKGENKNKKESNKQLINGLILNQKQARKSKIHLAQSVEVQENF